MEQLLYGFCRQLLLFDSVRFGALLLGLEQFPFRLNLGLEFSPRVIDLGRRLPVMLLRFLCRSFSRIWLRLLGLVLRAGRHGFRLHARRFSGPAGHCFGWS